jgi:hypothetical protein
VENSIITTGLEVAEKVKIPVPTEKSAAVRSALFNSNQSD